MVHVLRAGVTVIAVLAVVVAAAAGVLVWRVSRAPLALDFLRPRLEAALDAWPAAPRVRFGALQLAWDQDRHQLELKASDVRLSVSGASDAIVLDTVEVRPSLPELLRRTVAFDFIEVVRPRVRVVVNPDGRIGLSLERGAEVPPSAVPAEAVGAAVPHPDVLLDQLRVENFAVRDGVVSIVDAGSGVVATAQGVTAGMRRTADGVVAHATAALAAGTTTCAVAADATYHHDTGVTDGQIGLRDLVPAAVSQALGAAAARHPPLAQVLPVLAAIDLPVQVTVATAFDQAFHLTRAALTVTAGAGTVTVPGGPPGPLDVRRAQLRAAVDPAAGRYEVREAQIDLGDVTVRADGVMTKATSGSLEAQASVDAMPVGLLAKYWPPSVATSARQWVIANIRDGLVRDLRVKLRGTQPATADSSFALDTIGGTFAFENLRLRYLDTMAPLTGLAGTATVSASGLTFAVVDGRLGDVRLKRGDVRLSGLDGPRPRIAIDTDVEGPLSSTVALLAGEPVRLSRLIGIEPVQVGGTMSTRLRFDFGLDGALGFDNLGLRVTSALRDVSVQRLVDDRALTEGKLDLELDRNAVQVRGDGRLQGVPVTGTLRQDFGKAGGLAVEVRGRTERQDRVALGVDPGAWLGGPVDVTARLSSAGAGQYRVDLDVDARGATLTLGAAPPLEKVAGTPATARARLLLRGGELAAVDRFEIAMPQTSLTGRATRSADRRRWDSVEAHLDATGSVSGARTHATLSVKPGKGGQTVKLTADDAGGALDVLGETYIGGGSLAFEGTTDLSAAGPPVHGRLDVRKFRLVGAPWLVRVVTLASLSGLMRAASNEGVAFDQGAAIVDWQPSGMTVRDGTATGPSLTFHGHGSYDAQAQRLDFFGTLIPSYYGLNQAGSDIPIVGGLVSRLTGGAIQAFDFRVTGSPGRPDVTLQPSSLAPGALRDLMRIFQR